MTDKQFSFSFKEECWLPVVGFEGCYEVSNKGRIRSLDRKVWNGKVWFFKKGIILKMSKTTTGYWKVELSKKGVKKKSFKVHRLVAIAFVENIEGKPNVNHIDGDPLNNNAENLEWCTQKENMLHAARNGLCNGGKNPYINKEQIVKEYLADRKISVSALSKKYKCMQSTISKYLRESGVSIRNPVKYDIDFEELKSDFEKGMSNVEIAKKYKTNKTLIATYKYKHKRGELI